MLAVPHPDSQGSITREDIEPRARLHESSPVGSTGKDRPLGPDLLPPGAAAQENQTEIDSNGSSLFDPLTVQ